MNAVASGMTPAERAVQALLAGCDMLLVDRNGARRDGGRRAGGGVRPHPPERIATALGRIAELRRLGAERPATRRSASLGWPAHARLARRLAAA